MLDQLRSALILCHALLANHRRSSAWHWEIHLNFLQICCFCLTVGIATFFLIQIQKAPLGRKLHAEHPYAVVASHTCIIMLALIWSSSNAYSRWRTRQTWTWTVLSILGLQDQLHVPLLGAGFMGPTGLVLCAGGSLLLRNNIAWEGLVGNLAKSVQHPCQSWANCQILGHASSALDYVLRLASQQKCKAWSNIDSPRSSGLQPCLEAHKLPYSKALLAPQPLFPSTGQGWDSQINANFRACAQQSDAVSAAHFHGNVVFQGPVTILCHPSGLQQRHKELSASRG